MPPRRGSKLVVGDDVARFWAKTRVEGSCVLWTGAKDRDGYGKFMTGPSGGQKTHRPHRWIYELVIGPAGPQILHSCDRRACVALQHLSPGSQSQNISEAVARGRHDPHAKLTADQVVEIRSALARGETHRAIADRYGVSKATVSHISSGRNWSKR